MAHIIQFPCGTPAPAPAPARSPATTSRGRKPKYASRGKVVPIKRGVRVPKANRPEDDGTITFANIAKISANNAYNYAQSEPNSERHRMALHMAGIVEKLPRNNLRVYTTSDDIVEGIHKAWWRAHIASLERTLVQARRIAASQNGDEAARERWSRAQDQAEANAWREYERLVRVPADSLTDFKHFKLNARFEGGMGSIKWMRSYKPELAALLDEEEARLIAQKEARAAARAAKKREAGA